MGAFLSGLVAAFKGVQALRDIIDQFTDLWIKYEDQKDETQYDEKAKKRDAIIASLSQPGLTNAQRSQLRSMLWALNRM